MLAGYVGIDVQSYDSKLYDNTTNALLVDFGNNSSDDGIANSVYYTGAIGIRYKLSKSFEFALKELMYL